MSIDNLKEALNQKKIKHTTNSDLNCKKNLATFRQKIDELYDLFKRSLNEVIEEGLLEIKVRKYTPLAHHDLGDAPINQLIIRIYGDEILLTPKYNAEFGFFIVMNSCVSEEMIRFALVDNNYEIGFNDIDDWHWIFLTSTIPLPNIYPEDSLREEVSKEVITNSILMFTK